MFTDALKTQRALCALSQISPDKVPDAITALYHAYWVEGQQVNKPDVIEAVLRKALSADVVKKVMEGVSYAAAVYLSISEFCLGGLINTGRAVCHPGSEAAIDVQHR